MDSKINNLIQNYKYIEYRNYRIISREERQKFLYKKIRKLEQKRNSWLIKEKKKGKILGILLLRILDWDTEHFGIKMASIDYIITLKDLTYANDLKTKNRLISQAIDIARRQKIKHITCKTDCSDFTSVTALQDNKFYLMDTLLTFIFTTKDKVPKLKYLYNVRKAKNGDLNSLIEIATGRFRNSRFHRDKHLNYKKSEDLYKKWIENYLVNHTVIVTEKKGKVVGFLGYKLNQALNKFTGIKIIGRGLSAVLPVAKGAYLTLVKQVTEDVKENYHVAEFDGKISSYEVIKVWRRLGFSMPKAKYIWHNWIDYTK